MTPKAIAKLRRTFIAIAMASFFVVIAFMSVTTIVSNVVTMRQEASRTIDAIIDADGGTPGERNFREGPFHAEASFGLRFFTVSFDELGNVTDVDLSHVTLVDRALALEAAKNAADPNTITGLSEYENYLYKEGKTDSGSMVVFLDCAVPLANTRQVVFNTIVLSAGALFVTLLSIFFFSKRAIRPEIENAKRQREFVTNASHELKTPIAVIRANTELTEMMSGETEWTQATLRQVDRLEILVRDLMTIARGEEKASNEKEANAIDVSKIVSDAVESFRSLAQQQSLNLKPEIEAGISLRGHASSIEQLTCLLVDNAIKYCDEQGSIIVKLSRARLGRGCSLIVSNDYEAGANIDYQRFFDRFYREDESHENQTGYGIGLSVAESICKSYHGSIKASWKAGVISFACTLKDA